MGDRELRRWVDDRLHTVLGFAESHLTDYVVSLAKSAKSAAGLLGKLHEADVPKTEATQRFAAELFGRVPRGGGSSAKSSDAAAQKERRDAVNLLKQNASYGFVDADGDDDDDGEAEVNAAVQRELRGGEVHGRRTKRMPAGLGGQRVRRTKG